MPDSGAPGREVALSVVIPCRGQAEPLARCLRALAAQRAAPPFEVIVVDAAADPEVKRVVESRPDVTLVRSAAGLLPGAARNLGARRARAERLAFTDADCVPEPDWVAAAAGALAPGVRIAGGPVLDARPRHPIAAADHLLEFADFGPRRPEGSAPHLPGCNLVVARGSFEALGGFPSDVYPGEDTVFTTAAAARWVGEVRFSRALRVGHAGRSGLRAFWRHHAEFGFARGRLGLRLRPFVADQGHRGVVALGLAAVRLGYLVRRTARWRPSALPRCLLLIPLLLVGLAAWGGGFRRGRAAARMGAA